MTKERTRWSKGQQRAKGRGRKRMAGWAREGKNERGKKAPRRWSRNKGSGIDMCFDL